MTVKSDSVLQDEGLQLLTKNSRRAALISLAGGVIILIGLAGSAWKVAELQKREASIQANVNRLNGETARLTAVKRGLLDDIEKAKSASAQANIQIAEGRLQEAQATLKASVDAPIPSVSAAEQARVSVGRIYFQVRSDAQADLFRRCVPDLLAAGYRVPAADHVKIGPKRTELRYFHPEDKDAAVKLRGQLQTCLGQPVALSNPSYKGINPLHFEVWLGPPA